MEIRILGAHSCETPSASFVCFLVDGVLAVDAGGLTAHLSLAEQQRLKAIVLTHGHFDHIRDIPGIALNLHHCGGGISVHATPAVCDTITAHLLNGSIFPEFQKIPADRPTVTFCPVTPLVSQGIAGYSILPVPVNHCVGAVGYQITDGEGSSVFYTADTGAGLLECWRHISPQLLLIDVTQPDDGQDFARQTRHLTPALLEKELLAFRDCRGYLPGVIAVHMDASREGRIKEGLAEVARRNGILVTVAYEGMRVRVGRPGPAESPGLPLSRRPIRAV
jgi:ribonuclease BN (tRNA processing enzyme)